jgi:hypothetical protein
MNYVFGGFQYRKILLLRYKDLYSPLSSLDLPFPEGIWQIGFQSYDWAGNEEPLQQINLKIDQTPPVSNANIQGCAGYFTHPPGKLACKGLETLE